MKIRLDDKHTLNSDAYCYWITALVQPVGKDGQPLKPYEKRVSGYTATFEDAVTDYIDSKIRLSEATEISELARDVEKLKSEVKGWSNED